LDIAKRYEREEVECLPRMHGCPVESQEGSYKDALGEVFEALQLTSGRGSFTPFEVSRLMAEILRCGAAAEIEHRVSSR
jgi:hypothetical protein